MAAEIKGSDGFASSDGDDFLNTTGTTSSDETSQQVHHTPERPPTGEAVQLQTERIMKELKSLFATPDPSWAAARPPRPADLAGSDARKSASDWLKLKLQRCHLNHQIQHKSQKKKKKKPEQLPSNAASDQSPISRRTQVISSLPGEGSSPFCWPGLLIGAQVSAAVCLGGSAAPFGADVATESTEPPPAT